jgi:hypothetical protein
MRTVLLIILISGCSANSEFDAAVHNHPGGRLDVCYKATCDLAEDAGFADLGDSSAEADADLELPDSGVAVDGAVSDSATVELDGAVQVPDAAMPPLNLGICDICDQESDCRPELVCVWIKKDASKRCMPCQHVAQNPGVPEWMGNACLATCSRPTGLSSSGTFPGDPIGYAPQTFCFPDDGLPITCDEWLGRFGEALFAAEQMP